MVLEREDDEYLAICCECGNIVEGDEAGYHMHDTYCDSCYRAYFEDDEDD